MKMTEKLKFLLIDTSNENLTVVVLYNQGKVKIKNVSEARGHIKNLMPLISEILSEENIKISDLSFISLVEGPGSWTGLRIAFSTVKVLCLVNNLKLICINNFDVFTKALGLTGSKIILMKSSNQNFYFRYVVVNHEKVDGITSQKNIDEKYPNVHCYLFERPDNTFFIEEAIELYVNKKFTDVDKSEPYYISEGDLKSNFKKAKI